MFQFFLFLYFISILCFCIFSDICQSLKLILTAVCISFCFLVEVFDYVRYNGRNSFWCRKRVFFINSGNILVFHTVFHSDCFYVINTERQNIVVVDGIHNSVSMKLFAKGLICCSNSSGPISTCIFLENWGSCKSKQMEFLKALYNILMQITKLRTMTFIKNHNNMTLENWMTFILFDEKSKLLNCGNNNLTVIVFKLFFEDGNRFV